CVEAGCASELGIEASGLGFFDGSITSKANKAMINITITRIPSGFGCPVLSSYMKLLIPRIAEPRYGTGTIPWYTPTTCELEIIVSAVPHRASQESEPGFASPFVWKEYPLLFLTSLITR